MPVVKVKCILFDMDGTLVDSTPGVIQAWTNFSRQYHFDAPTVIQATHGTRVIDSLRLYCGITDPDILKAEVARFESEVLSATEDGKGIQVLPGVHALFDQIRSNAQAARRWAVVTSATSVYAPEALKATNIPIPEVLITSDLVSKGKPDPEPYLVGARACGVDPSECLVVEDAPAGIRSGQAAGALTLAVCTSHTREALLTSKPDYIVKDLSRVSARWTGDTLEITFDDSAE